MKTLWVGLQETNNFFFRPNPPHCYCFRKQEKIDSLLEMNEKMSLKLSEQASTARQLTEVKENQQR